MPAKKKSTPLVSRKALLGKTIVGVDNRAVNCLTLTFSDGTKATLEVEAMGIPGLYGIVAVDSSPGT